MISQYTVGFFDAGDALRFFSLHLIEGCVSTIDS